MYLVARTRLFEQYQTARAPTERRASLDTGATFFIFSVSTLVHPSEAMGFRRNRPSGLMTPFIRCGRKESRVKIPILSLNLWQTTYQRCDKRVCILPGVPTGTIARDVILSVCQLAAQVKMIKIGS